MASDSGGAHRPKRQRGPNSATPARRAAIIRAAIESFAERGFDGSSLRDIARRADMTHSGVLRHFSSKDELLLAALNQRELEDQRVTRSIVDAASSPHGIVTEILRDEFLSPDRQRNWLAIAVAASDKSHPAHEFYRGRRARLQAQFHEGLLESGQHSTTTAQHRAVLLLAMLDGIRLQALLDPEIDPLELLEEFVGMLIDDKSQA